MNEVEYVLRIILRARDELAAGLAKARTQLRGFKTDTESMNTALGNLNKTLSTFDGHLGNIEKKINNWRAALRDTNKDGKELSKTFDALGKQAESTGRKISTAGKTQEQLQQQARALRKEMLGIHQARKDEAIDVEFASKKYKQLADQLNTIALSMSRAARTKTPANEWARQAREAAEEIKDVDKEMLEDRKRYAAEEKRILNDISTAVKDFSDRRAAQEKASVEIAKSTTADRIRLANAELDAMEKRRVAQEKAADADEKNAQAALARQQQISRLAERSRVIGGRRRPEAGDAEELRAIAKEYDKLADSVKDNEDEFRRFATAASRVRAVIKDIGDDSGRSRRGIIGLGSDFSKLGDNVATVDNKLRGILLLAVASFAEQLTTAVAGLGGELVALAGSAAMAGGALGGILAAGAAQALPVIGLLAGAVSRVKAVTDAFQQSQKLQQAQFTDQEKGAQKAIDKTNALASAQDTVTAANERLAESRKDLTKAQKDGVDQLQDLIFAEREAALAAKGAALNVQEAQKALKDAIAGGASALEIQQRQQSLDEAKLRRDQTRAGARRARADVREAGGQVGNLPDVQQAQKQVKDAERAVASASRGLDQAQDKTDRLASTTMTAAANLNFLLSQLSPAERKLYNSFQRFYTDYRRIFIGDHRRSGVYGVIVSAFADAVDAVDRIMRRPKVIRTVQSLANEIAKQFRKVTAFFTGDELDQFIEITKDAKDNLGPVVDIVLDLADAFTNIAVEANPAFQQLLDYIGPIVDKFLGMTEDKGKMEDFFTSGEEHLETWLDLILAIIDLFAALFGASADTGKKSIEELTDQVKDWTKWIEDNGDKVRKFFEDAHDVVKDIAGVVGELATQIFDTFDADHLQEFAEFFEKTLLPAIGSVVRAMGDITDKILEIVNSPVGSFAAKWGVIGLIVAQIATSAFGAANYVKNLVGHFKDLAKLFPGFNRDGKKAKDLLDDFDKRHADREKEKQRIPDRDAREADRGGAARRGGVRGALGRVFPGLAGGAAAGAGAEAGGAAGGVAAGIGAAGLATVAVIAAIVVGIGLLLTAFHKWGEIWDAIKKAASDFMEFIQPAFQDLQDALDDLGIHFTDLSDIVDYLWNNVLSGLADFITDVLVGVITGLGDVLAGVVTFIVDTLAGAIEIVKGFVEIIIGIFKLLFGDQSGWEQIKKGLEDIGKGIADIFEGIIKGIWKIFEGFAEAFIGIFTGAWKAIKKWFGVDSPSKKAIELGQAILDGIRDGLRGLLRILTWPFRHAWNLIKDIFHLDKIEDFGKDIVKALGRGLRDGFDLLKKAAKWLWERFKDGFEGAKKFGTTVVNAIIDGIKTLPTILWDAIQEIGGKIIDVGKALGGFLWKGVKSVVGGIGSVLGIGGDDKEEPKRPQAPARARTVETSVQGPVPFGAKDLDDAREMWRQFWRDLRGAARQGDDFIRAQFREMRIGSARSADNMYRDIRGSLADIQDSLNVRGARIRTSWSDLWVDLMKVSYDGLFYIAHQTNLALKGLGEKTVNFGLTQPKTEKKQRGGIIGGWGDGDKIHVMAEPGEGFINKRAVRALGGPAVIDAINRLFPRFQEGGIVPIPGQPGESINSSILGDVMKLIRTYKLVVYDGWAPMGTHAPNSDHHWGGAIDVGPGPTGSWNLVDKLAHWAEPSQNNPRSPFRWVGYDGDPGHGRGNHLHLSWLRGAHLAGALGMVSKVLRPLVTGPGGALKDIAQASLDMARKAANALLDTAIGATFEPGEVPSKGGGSPAANIQLGAKIVKAMYGWIGAQFQALKTLWTGESGWNEMAYNASSGATGIPQSLPGSKMASAGPDWKTNPATQIKWGAKYIKDRYGDPISALAAWMSRSPHWYAAGGVVPGGDGTPVSIVAHAGEWILNKFQQSNLAKMLGMNPSALRAMLGFHGGGGHFQGGGEIRTHFGPTPQVSQRAAAGRAIERGLDAYQKLLFDVEQTWNKIGEQSAIALAKNKRRAGNYQKIIKQIDSMVAEKGTLDTLATAISDQFDKMGVRLKAATYKIAGGIVTRRLGNVSVAQRTLADIVSNYNDLVGERGIIHDTLGSINKQIAKVTKDPKLSKNQRKTLLNQLDGQRVDVIKRLDEVDSQIADATEARFQAQIAVQQAVIDRINRVADVKSKAQELQKRLAVAMGKPVDAINNQILSDMALQASQLEDQVAATRAAGGTELANQIAEQAAELRAQITELTAQMFQESIDNINKTAQRTLGHLDLFQRMADALDVVGQNVGVGIPTLPGVFSRAGIFAARGRALEEQRGGLQGKLGEAAAAGNLQAMEDLTDQIAELDVSIQENTKAAFDAKISASQDAFDFSTTMNDLNLRLVDAKDAVTGLTSTNDRLALLNEKQRLLTDRNTELLGLLAEATPGTKTYQDLQKALLENQIAVEENSKTIQDVTGEGTAPQSFSSLGWQWFGNALFGGTGSLLPRYNLPSSVAGLGPMGPGGAGPLGNATSQNGNTFITNVEVNEAGQPIDTTKLAGAVVFAQSTAQ
jgi:chromosome segregation ATPase